jgi:hypothetical protein
MTTDPPELGSGAPLAASSRRTSAVTVAVVALVAAGVAGGAFALSRVRRHPTSTVTVRQLPGAVGCGSVVDERADPDPKHVEGPIDYGEAPPSSGRHNPSPLQPYPPMYVRETAPTLVVERAVHNLEHAYVVVWYDDDASGEELTQIGTAVTAAEGGKVIAVPWDRRDFARREVVMTAWGHRQTCVGITTDDVNAFVARYGGLHGDAPEKGAL